MPRPIRCSRSWGSPGPCGRRACRSRPTARRRSSRAAPRGGARLGRGLLGRPGHAVPRPRARAALRRGVPRLVRGRAAPARRRPATARARPHVGAAGRGRRRRQPPRRAARDRGGAGPRSAADVLRHRDVAELSVAERALLAQMFAALRPVAPLRRALRRAPWHSGEFDARRTLREELRRGGEPGRLRYRRPRTRPRRVVLLVDVSGSMTPYADALLRLAHVWVRSAPRSTEVFTVGTRLTRVTVPSERETPRPRCARRGSRCPTGRAAPGSATWSRRSSTAGAPGASRAGPSSSSSATAGNGGRRACSPTRWPGCTAWRTASCG